MKRGPRPGSLEQYKSTNHPGQLTPSASHIHTPCFTLTHSQRSEDCQHRVEKERSSAQTRLTGLARLENKVCVLSMDSNAWGLKVLFSQTCTYSVAICMHPHTHTYTHTMRELTTFQKVFLLSKHGQALLRSLPKQSRILPTTECEHSHSLEQQDVIVRKHKRVNPYFYVTYQRACMPSGVYSERKRSR